MRQRHTIAQLRDALRPEHRARIMDRVHTDMRTLQDAYGKEYVSFDWDTDGDDDSPRPNIFLPPIDCNILDIIYVIKYFDGDVGMSPEFPNGIPDKEFHIIGDERETENDYCVVFPDYANSRTFANMQDAIKFANERIA